MCVPKAPFFSAARNMISPFFQQKVYDWPDFSWLIYERKGKRKVQGVPQSQTAALSRPQEEEETDKSKQAQIEQTYEKY